MHRLIDKSPFFLELLPPLKLHLLENHIVDWLKEKKSLGAFSEQFVEKSHQEVLNSKFRKTEKKYEDVFNFNALFSSSLVDFPKVKPQFCSACMLHGFLTLRKKHCCPYQLQKKHKNHVISHHQAKENILN